MKQGLVFLFVMVSGLLMSQVQQPVKWSFSYNRIDNNKIEVVANATIDKGWHVYSAYLPADGPIPTSLVLKDSSTFKLSGGVIETPLPEKHFDNSFGVELAFFKNNAKISQVVELSSNSSFKLNGHVEFMVCNDEQCLPPDIIKFTLDIIPEVSKAIDTKEETIIEIARPIVIPTNTNLSDSIQTSLEPSAQSNSEQPKSYMAIFLLAFLGGLAALLTPCVFPMIPMTVSFFTKQSKSKADGIKNAAVFGLSIIGIYVLLGTVVTAIFGADSLNALSTNPWFNLFFAILLIVFAISFFGAFEIVLPSTWVNAADKKVDKGGLIGIFFMAFTLVLVSFSCTGPIVGSLIVQAAREGGSAPVIGMLGFSLGIAIPFTFFAAFPGYLNSLPKSGGWLNSVKVVLGFLELAFAFKFLSIADMVLDLHLLEREVFIAIWIVVFAALGFYLLGKIRLPHDSPMEHIPVSRFMLALTVFGFTVYMIPGLWGAPVNLISGFPPPKEYAESPWGVGNDGPEVNLLNVSGLSSGLPDHMHYGPQGIPAFDDFENALAYAKKVNKPLLLDFTGKGCVNCRKMEDKVWSDNEIKQILTNDYVLVSLYVDLRIDLPKDKQYVSKSTGKEIVTIGNKWSDFQIERFNRNSQPHYVILDYDENELLESKSYDPDINSYKIWLKKGLELFKHKI